MKARGNTKTSGPAVVDEEIVEDPYRYRGGLFATLARDWNDFWFKWTPSGPIGMCRIAIGLTILYCIYQLWPDRMAFFSERGIMTTTDSNLYNRWCFPAAWRPPILDLLHGAPDWWISLFFLLYTIAAICMTIGYKTRPAIFLVYVGLNSIHNRNALNNTTGYDVMQVCFVMYLFFARSGAACSVDRLLRVLKGKEGANAPAIPIWPVRLMQIQLSIIYATTFMAKERGDLWQNGIAIWYPYQISDVHKFTMPFVDGHHLAVINALTYGSMAIEFALCLLVWVPRMRLYVLAAGVALHIGIELMIGIPVFSWVMISCYWAFITREDLRRFTAWYAARFRVSPLRVLYDPESPRMKSWKLVLERFDIFRRIKFQAEPPSAAFDGSQASILAVNPRGKTYEGFFAFRQVARREPLLWPLVPFLYVIGIAVPKRAKVAV